jgi:hypothetical protein
MELMEDEICMSSSRETDGFIQAQCSPAVHICAFST